MKPHFSGEELPSRVSILLVDDQPSNLLALGAILQDLGHNLVSVRSGDEALRKLLDQEFALVLLDVQMPGLDGFETAKLIRGRDSSVHTPIIFLTAFESDRFLVEKAYALGAVDYLVKPLVPIIVRAKVAGFVDLFKKTEQVKQQAERIRQMERREFEERLAEENARLREQREWLRVTLASIGDAVITTDTAGRVTFLNPVAQTLTGWADAEAHGRPLDEVFHVLHEQTRNRVENSVAKIDRDEVAKGFDNQSLLVARDGTERPIDDNAALIRDNNGAILGVILVFRDISERKRGEAALRESEEKLRLLADTIPQLAWMTRPDGYIFWYNRRWYEYTGKTPAEMEGWGWQSVHDPEVLPKVLERWRASIASGETFDMVFPVRGSDGIMRPFLSRSMPLRAADGRILGWFGTNTDITEQVQAEQALRQSEKQQRFLSEVSAALVGSLHSQSILNQVAELTVPTLGDFCFFDVLTDDNRLERVGWKHVDPSNRDWAEIVRKFVPAKDIEDHPVRRAIHSGKPEFVPDITDEWLQSAAMSAEHLQFLRDLGLRSLMTVPMIVGGRRLGALTFGFTISGRRHTAEELRLAEEIARRTALTMENAHLYDVLRDNDRRKDEFLATLAHELRNPLAPIRNSLQILKMDNVDATIVQQTRDMMERQVQHLVRLVDDLLDVSRVMRGKIELRKEAVELASVVARAVETAKPIIDAQGHRLEISVPPGSLLLDADPVRLAQVIGNLLTNSAKYTEANGHIWLTATRKGDSSELRIRDDGIGISPEILPRVFDLFVQEDYAATRSQGGLGIGLTLVKNLVEMHNGSVKAFSAGLGRGSEFVVQLPLASNGEARVVPDHDRHVPGASSGRRLLVVDDNKDAAISLAMLLRLHGHEVQVAHDGPSALAVVAAYRPEMIFLDIGMPGMDGYEVARRVRELPGLESVRLAAVTGWGQQEDRRRSKEAGFDHHLVKPPEPKALEEVLRALGPR